MPDRKATERASAEKTTTTRVSAKARGRICRQEQGGRNLATSVASACTGAKAVQLTIFDYAAALGVSLFPEPATPRSAQKPRRRREAKAS